MTCLQCYLQLFIIWNCIRTKKKLQLHKPTPPHHSGLKVTVSKRSSFVASLYTADLWCFALAFLRLLTFTFKAFERLWFHYFYFQGL